jgi:hypothetical protein
MTEHPIHVAAGGLLTRVLYWVVDRPRGLPWSRLPIAFQRVDFGLDLVFGSQAIALGWRQTQDRYVLDLSADSLGTRFPQAVGVEAGHVEPWREVIGTRLLGIRELEHEKESGLPVFAELAWEDRLIVVGAASYLADEDVILPGCDEIMIFSAREKFADYWTRRLEVG